MDAEEVSEDALGASNGEDFVALALRASDEWLDGEGVVGPDREKATSLFGEGTWAEG